MKYFKIQNWKYAPERSIVGVLATREIVKIPLFELVEISINEYDNILSLLEEKGKISIK